MAVYNVVMYDRSMDLSCDLFQFIPHTGYVNVTLILSSNASWTSFDVFAQQSCVDLTRNIHPFMGILYEVIFTDGLMVQFVPLRLVCGIPRMYRC